MSDTVLLVGASGELGSRIAARLLETGTSLRAMTRHPESLRELASAGATVVEGDLMDPASLDAVLDVRQVITTANSFIGRGRHGPARVDRVGNRNLIEAARGAGVGHFLFVSANVPDAFRRIDYFAIKAETESFLQDSGLRHTILKPTAFLETWGRIVGDSIRDKGVAPVFGPGQQRTNYIAIDDVARVVALLAATVPDENRVIDIGGPDNLTAHELIDVLATALQRTAKRKTVPLPMLRLLGAVAGVFDPVAGRKMKTGYASATAGEPFDFSRVESQFPIAWTTAIAWAEQNYGGKECRSPVS